jgi:hypothetical protein
MGRKTVVVSEAEKAAEQELMDRVGTECFRLVKECAGTADYAANKRMAGQLLLHYEWMCDIQVAMDPDAFADRRRPDSAADRIDVVHQAPFSFVQYCRSFCRVVVDGTRRQHLELLFQLYARERPRLVSWAECRRVAAKHVSFGGKNGKAAFSPDEMDSTFAILDADGDGYLDKGEFLELWARHRDLEKRVALDLEAALGDVADADATERSAVSRPLEYAKKSKGGFAFLVPTAPAGPAAPAVDDVKRGRHTQIVHDIKTEHEDREKAQRKWQEREAQRRRAQEPGYVAPHETERTVRALSPPAHNRAIPASTPEEDAPPERATVLASFIKVGKPSAAQTPDPEPAARASSRAGSRAGSSRAASRGASRGASR